MKYFIAHAGEDHSTPEIAQTETIGANTLLPIIVVSLVSLTTLAAIARLLSGINKKKATSTQQEES